MKRLRIKDFNITNYLAAFMLLSVVPAFFVWHSVWYSYFIVFLSAIFVYYIINKGADKKNTIIAFLLFAFFSIYIIRAGLNIYGAIEVFCLMPLFLAKRESLLGVYNAFLKIFAIAMALGIPFYILVVWFDISLPNVEIEPFNRDKIFRYFVYPFFVTQEGYFSSLNPRFYGLFDEPGVVGTISAIFLISEKFNFKKWENIIVLISGILSASLFFFLVCGVYVLLESPIKAKIAVVIIAVITILLLYDNEILYNIFFHRFNIADGNLEGMNREHGDFSAFYDRFRHSSDYWFGLGSGAGVKVNEGGSSYKQLVVDYGIVFFVAYLSCYYLYSVGKLRGFKQVFVFSLFFLGTMYQRPFIGTPTLTFLMIASVHAISVNYTNKNRTTNGGTVSISHSNSL